MNSKSSCVMCAVFLTPLLVCLQSANLLSQDSSNTVAYQNVFDDETKSLNQGLKNGTPTVDVAIYLCESSKQKHPLSSKPSDLVDSIREAKRIFKEAGLQIKIQFIKRAVVPESWISLTANTVNGVAVDPKFNTYLGYRKAKWALSDKAKVVFDKVIEPAKENRRTVYLVYLKQVRMAYLDRSDPKKKPMIKSIPTGGLSIPAYLFEDRIPKRIRGVITLCKDNGKHGRTIAHELGHKLINVSHEYRDIDPRFEVRGEGGLMIYGSGTEIPAGKAGRYQRERLHLSPFVYREAQKGSRMWNDEYKEHGHYFDPIYGDQVIRFGDMNLPDK